MASGGQVRYPQFQAPLIRGFNLTIFCKWTIFPSKVQSLQSPYSMCPLVICYSLLLKMAHRNSWFTELKDADVPVRKLLVYQRVSFCFKIFLPRLGDWRRFNFLLPNVRSSNADHFHRRYWGIPNFHPSPRSSISWNLVRTKAIAPMCYTRHLAVESNLSKI